MSEDLKQTLKSIRPSTAGMVMDLVAEAGIDVSAWHFKSDGTQVKNPRANPHYCYEWSFGGGGQPTALCIWHRDIKSGQDVIEYEDSLRQYALELDRVAIEQRNPSHVKSRARDQAKRARNFDSHVQRAYRSGLPVKVILLVGEDRGIEEIGWDTSKVKYRSLDNEPWFVHRYSDEDGRFRLVRRVPLSISDAPEQEVETETLYADQFSIPSQPERVRIETDVVPRSAEVRKKVLQRAKGFCEYCGEPGFQMANGAVYLETHHVVPLADAGPDEEWNVIAICPNDHRRAHYAMDRDRLTNELIEKLVKQEPLARDALITLASRKKQEGRDL